MKFVAESIWRDGKNGLRSKSRTVDIKVTKEDLKSRNIMTEIINVDLYSEWSYDGSSTGQATGSDSEIILKPVYVCTDPFRKAPNVFVLCTTYNPNGEPTVTNTRHNAEKIFSQNKNLEPWFAIEQEFFLMKSCQKHPTKKSIKPLGWREDAVEQGQYYCSIGAENAFGRTVAERAYHLILEAGLNASGMNAEVAPGQWEIQIGPSGGLMTCDQLWISRYILERVGELNGVQINYDPKPIDGNWNGSGGHVNYSTKPMREEGGYPIIIDAIEKLEKNHLKHMKVYGEGNEKRMSGKHETSSYNNFTWGVANRGASIRIPRNTEKDGKGYLEDRRPSANLDPYLVTSIIFETTTEGLSSVLPESEPESKILDEVLHEVLQEVLE